MADYQRVVEFLRDFRASAANGTQAVTDEVRQAAADYAALCADANERLRQCNVLLQRGLRAEAINLAEASPSLLDLTAALDLPDPEGWAEFCQRNDLPVPPPLQIERAAALNDAYGQGEPVEVLFARHRRLALAKAPVAKRLDVMRQIAQADPSPFWDKDIRTFEAARFKELRVSFAGAIRDRDVNRLGTLAKEVIESPWAEAVPPDLETAARDVHGRMRSAELEQALAGVMDRLRSAYAARSVADAAALIAQARDLPAQYGAAAGLPPAVAAEIEPIAAWVQHEQQIAARQQAFAAACDLLRQALDVEAPPAELEAAYRGAASHDQPVPADLDERYDALAHRRAKAGQRKFVLALAGIAAVLVVALVAGYSVMQSREAGRWADRINQAVAKRELAVAQQVVEEQERRAPKFNDSPPVAAAKQRAAVLKQEYDRDVGALRSAVAQLDQAVRQGAAAATDAAPLDELRAAQGAVEAALAQRKGLPDLTWVDANNRVAGLTARLEQLRDELRGRGIRTVAARAEAAGRQADAMAAGGSLAEAEQALAALDRDLAALAPFAERGSGADVALAAALRKVTARRDGMRLARAEFDARRALASKFGSAASARQALTDFVRQFPSSPVAADFTRAAAATDLYASVEAWHVLSSPWAASLEPKSEKAATQRLDLVRTYLRDYPASPVAPAAGRYAGYLQGAADGMALENGYQQATQAVMSNPVVVDLKFLQSTTGERFYLLAEPNMRVQDIGGRKKYTFEVLDPQNFGKRLEVVPTPPGLLSEKPQPVPHAEFARTLAAQMKLVNDQNWATWGIDAADRIAAETKIDPVVRAWVLRDVLTATVRVAGWGVGDAYDKAIADLTRQRLEEIVFYDPERPVSPVTVSSLQQIVAALPRPADVKQRLEANRKAILAGARPAFAGQGVLLRDDAGAWVVHAAGPVLPGATAVAVVAPQGGGNGTAPAAAPATGPAGAANGETPPVDPSAAAGAGPAVPATFVTVATWKGDRLVVDETAARRFPEGTMVLITRPEVRPAPAAATPATTTRPVR